VRKTLQNALAILICVAFLFPLAWILLTSVKPNAEVFTNQVRLLPSRITLDPWIEQITSWDFMRSLRNSFTIAACNMVLSTMLGIAAAYGLARFSVPFRRAIMLLFLVTQMMPSTAIPRRCLLSLPILSHSL
jgi:ABC-type glycerol-3-phosphate transport system permease component